MNLYCRTKVLSGCSAVFIMVCTVIKAHCDACRAMTSHEDEVAIAPRYPYGLSSRCINWTIKHAKLVTPDGSIRHSVVCGQKCDKHA